MNYIEHPLILTEKVLNPRAQREKATQTVYETCTCLFILFVGYFCLFKDNLIPYFSAVNSPAFYLVSDAALCVYASGQTTGVAVHSGEQLCSAVAVYEGT